MYPGINSGQAQLNARITLKEVSGSGLTWVGPVACRCRCEVITVQLVGVGVVHVQRRGGGARCMHAYLHCIALTSQHTMLNVIQGKHMTTNVVTGPRPEVGHVQDGGR